MRACAAGTACVRVCVRACLHACVFACVRARVCVCVCGQEKSSYIDQTNNEEKLRVGSPDRVKKIKQESRTVLGVSRSKGRKSVISLLQAVLQCCVPCPNISENGRITTYITSHLPVRNYADFTENNRRLINDFPNRSGN